MLRLPGLIDPHVHMREPGATHKEDWASGTAAALAGGFTLVLAMPNTQPPVIDSNSLARARACAEAGARCDFGLFLGGSVDNTSQAAALASRSAGLKLYLDQTYGPLRLDELTSIAGHLSRWPSSRPIVAHAEGRSLAMVMALAYLHGRRLHVAHISRADEIGLVRLAKQRGWRVTCEVAPHHLFLCADDVPALGPGRAEVRPRLASRADQQALWDNMDVVDCFATDHAPHTLAEKDGSTPPPGFPGLETALALLLDAVHDDRLPQAALVERMVKGPRRIFGVRAQTQTVVEVDEHARWEVRGKELHSRCGWSPFEGRVLRGRVVRVILRGQEVYRDGQVLAAPGYGRNVFG